MVAFDSVMGPVLMGKKVQKQRENSGGMVGEVSGFFKNALPDTFELVKAQEPFCFITPQRSLCGESSQS